MNNYQKIENIQGVQGMQAQTGLYMVPGGQMGQYMNVQAQSADLLMQSKDEGYDVEDSKEDEGKIIILIFLFDI
jgi:hypothetical protein